MPLRIVPTGLAAVLRRLRREEKAATLPLVAIALAPVVIGGLALAIDTGARGMACRSGR